MGEAWCVCALFLGSVVCVCRFLGGGRVAWCVCCSWVACVCVCVLFFGCALDALERSLASVCARQRR